ncbi:MULTISPECIES: hypothetical protein [Pseudomonas syringae group]|uniref:hypothetical protein n=1 Tax=Pseudomonas syringae group TaxID=136849 RepID=UPI00210009E4|nr:MULTISPECIES: hypothetical protein [Pseudomonas syringae group]
MSELQKRLQAGAPNMAQANNLLAEAYAGIGRLIEENQSLRKECARLKEDNRALLENPGGRAMTFDIEKLEAQMKVRDENSYIATMQRLERNRDMWKGQVERQCEMLRLAHEAEKHLKAENAGLKTGYEAYERVNAGLNQRIANLELCQTASLGVSGIIKSAASELGFDAAGEDSALDHLIGLARSASALRVENEALRKSLCDVMTEVDGNIRETVRDCVNGRDDVQDIYGYCDSIEAIVDAAMSKEQSHD